MIAHRPRPGKYVLRCQSIAFYKSTRAALPLCFFDVGTWERACLIIAPLSLPIGIRFYGVSYQIARSSPIVKKRLQPAIKKQMNK